MDDEEFDNILKEEVFYFVGIKIKSAQYSKLFGKLDLCSELFMGDSNIKDKLKELCDALKENNLTKTLSLEDNNLGINEANYLKELFIHNTTLKKLELTNNNIKDEGCKYLSEALKGNTSLQKLNLEKNNIGDEGCKYLSEALKINKSLQKLDLTDNKIGNKGCDYLSETLTKENATLCALYFYDNKISTDGCKSLSEMLKKNKSLKKLNLGNNNIGNEGFKYLIEALKENTSLQELNLRKNDIGNEGCKNISEYISNSHSLQELNLDDNNIDKTIQDEIEKSLKNKKLLKIVVVGKEKVGKTTLIKKLLQHKRNLSFNGKNKLKKDKRTNGIKMQEWNTRFQTKSIQLWDFGGDEMFYSSHQFFLSPNSLYLVVFNLTDKLFENELSFWLNSIQYRAPKSKVIIIGTHMDKLDLKDWKEDIFRISEKVELIYNQITSNIFPKKTTKDNTDNSKIEVSRCSYWEFPRAKVISNNELFFFPISTKQKWNIKTLKDEIQKELSKHFVSNDFFNLKDKIISIRNEKVNSKKNPVLSREELSSIILDYCDNKYEEVSKNMNLLNDLGFILDFGMKYVIIYPQWLSYVFKSVLSLKTKLQIKDAVLPRKQIITNLKNILQKCRKYDETVIREKQKNIPSISTKDDTNQSKKKEFRFESYDNTDILLEIMETLNIINSSISFPEEPSSSIQKQSKRQSLTNQKISEPETKILIPSLLQSGRTKMVDSIFNPSYLSSTASSNNFDFGGKEFLGRKYLFPFIPRGMFEKIFGRISSFFSSIIFWKNGFFITVDKDKGYLMFEIKYPQAPRIRKTLSVDSMYSSKKGERKLSHVVQTKDLSSETYSKGGVIEIKSTGQLSHYLIAAFDFCVSSIFETEYPLIWNKVKIEIEYFNKENKYTNSKTQCLELYNKNKDEEIKAMGGLLIRWIKLLPEQFDEVSDKFSRNENLIPIPGRLREEKFAKFYQCKTLNSSTPTEFGSFSIMHINKDKQKLYKSKIELIQSLKHQNLLKYIGSLEKDSNTLLFFSFYTKSLKEFQVEDKDKESVCQAIFEGLEYLHGEKIVHFDLCSENIAVKLNKDTSLSNVYICGFSNIEKVDDENKWDKPISYFMVPEIKAFQTSDETTYNPFKAEIFVFGKLLSEILGSTQQESKFKKVIDHCTEEKPEERPTTKDIKTLYFK